MYAPVNFVILSIILGLNLWLVHSLMMSRTQETVQEPQPQLADQVIHELVQPQQQEVIEAPVQEPPPSVDEVPQEKKLAIRRRQKKEEIQEVVEETNK